MRGDLADGETLRARLRDCRIEVVIHFAAYALLAEASRAREVLGGSQSHSDLDRIIESAWRWHSSHPQGFDD